MADFRANIIILRDPTNTYLRNSLTPAGSKSRQAPSGAPADGLQYASQPVSRVGPGHVYSLRVIVNYYVVYGGACRLLWRTTRQATSLGHAQCKRDHAHAHVKN